MNILKTYKKCGIILKTNNLHQFAVAKEYQTGTLSSRYIRLFIYNRIFYFQTEKQLTQLHKFT